MFPFSVFASVRIVITSRQAKIRFGDWLKQSAFIMSFNHSRGLMFDPNYVHQTMKNCMWKYLPIHNSTESLEYSEMTRNYLQI